MFEQAHIALAAPSVGLAGRLYIGLPSLVKVKLTYLISAAKLQIKSRNAKPRLQNLAKSRNFCFIEGCFFLI
jgi:hypothetical protein